MSKLIVPGVAFMIASSPATFKVTRKVFGSWVGNFEGVATPAGLFLHMLFFLLVLWLTSKYLPMILPRAAGYGGNATQGMGCLRNSDCASNNCTNLMCQ